MKYIFDTHIIIWTLEDNKRLNQKVKDIIADKSARIFYIISGRKPIDLQSMG